jgi:hypothetical protein
MKNTLKFLGMLLIGAYQTVNAQTASFPTGQIYYEIQNTNGTLDIGAQNSSFCHLYTSLPGMAFNKPVYNTTGVYSATTGANLTLGTGSGTTYVARMTILTTGSSAGNVGIGTNNPYDRLDVAGNIRINNNVLYLRGTTDVNHGLKYTSSFAGSTILDGPALFGYSTGVLGTTNGGEKIALKWDYNGNVGIGTDLTSNTAGYKLSVNGYIRAKKIVVQTGWADFVFKKEYCLKPLSEVENFIQQNGHLPEIPAAADIETNGADLGEVARLQMQKIEELTLYVIEQNKKIEEQNKRIKALEQMIEKK